MAHPREKAVEGVDRSGLADEEFGALLDRALDRTYSLAGYLMGDAGEAEEATQDAMAKAWRSRRSLKDREAFEGWLDRILVNTCTDRLRRRRLVSFVPIDDRSEIPDGDPFRKTLARDEVGRALDRLTPEQRAVVVLRFWLDLPVDEIGRRLGCPSGTVKSRLHAALATLRRGLEAAELEANR